MVAGDLVGFSAFEIGEEYEAGSVVVFQEYGSLPGLLVFVDRRERHGVGLDDLELLSLIEPKLELREGIFGEVLSMQAFPGVILS